MEKAIKSPFKFLDAYEKEDKDAFFGRDAEIELLYQIAFQTNLTLVYGQSGTGKTSLIRCGLANRFEASDWFHLYVRRNDNINISLLNTVRESVAKIPQQRSSLEERLMKRFGKKADESGPDAPAVVISDDLNALLKTLYSYYLKPIYLLFDQFEELFILGGTEEQNAFYQQIEDIISTHSFVKVILVMREEYIAQMYDFEKILPNLFEKRLRVEPMDQTNARGVTGQSAKKFSIELENETIPQAIVDSITEGKGRVNLTFLQVFLDKLYRVAAARNPDKIVFDQATVHQLGRIDDVLTNFLEEQLEVFEQTIGSKNTALAFLQVFVSSKNTKVPISRNDLSTLLQDFSATKIKVCLDFFEDKRILRPLENDRYELAHDSLAIRLAGIEVEKTPVPTDIPGLVMPEKPFAGFQSFSPELAGVFFGRDREIRQLFDKVVNERKSRLTLMYGPIGVGKTSLLRAGLIPRLRQLYEVQYVRCGMRLLHRPEIRAMLENPPTNAAGDSLIFNTFFPGKDPERGRFCIVFDQFEEFFIWTTDADLLKNFYRHVDKLLQDHRNCRLVVAIREEFFANLSDFEVAVPSLLDNRMRLNHVSDENAAEIILNTLAQAGIELEERDIIESIIQNVSEDGKVNLSYLQLYMQRLVVEAV